MVLIHQLSVPEEGVIYTSSDVKLKVNDQQLGNGSLYITESALSWKPDGRVDGVSIRWPQVSVHAISTDPTPCVYVMVDFILQWPGVYEGPANRNANGMDGAGEDDEDNDEGNETDVSETDITEMWMQPSDPNTVEAIYNAMKQCQELHPDPADSVSEDEGEFMEAEGEDEEYEEVGQGEMRNLYLDDEEKFADAEE